MSETRFSQTHEAVTAPDVDALLYRDLPEPVVRQAELAVRLRIDAVHRKLARWLPCVETAALWSIDFAEIYAAADRLRASAIRLELLLETKAIHVESALKAVEADAAAYERAVIANVCLPAA